RIYTPYRSKHLRPEQDIIQIHHLEQQLNAALVVHASIEEDITHHMLLQWWPVEHVRQAAITAPVVGHRPATMGNDEAERRKVPEQITLYELHECRGVGVDIVRTGRVEASVAGR